MLTKISPKKLFLIDSIGALITSLVLAFVLARFEHLFGMPRKVLYLLSGIAFVFFLYSLICHLQVGPNWRPFLKGIALANLTYVMLTLGFLVHYFGGMSQLGVLYFLVEAFIIVCLSLLEFQAAKRPGN